MNALRAKYAFQMRGEEIKIHSVAYRWSPTIKKNKNKNKKSLCSVTTWDPRHCN